MSTSAWSEISITAVASDTGFLTQLYPTWAPVGIAKATETPAQQLREPCEGELVGLQIQTDGTNGGVIEIWDIAGDRAGADVSTAATITNTQKNTEVTAGRAKLLYSQNLLGTGETPPIPTYFRFMQGLAARFISGAGSVKINANVNGGFRLIHGSV